MSLTTKTLLTGASRFLAIALNIISQLILIPLIAVGLGDALYGIYVLINRTSGMISFADFRPSACLRYVLAQNQTETKRVLQNKYTTASYVVAFIFAPFILIACGVIIFIFPRLYNVPQQYITAALTGIAIIGIRILMQSFMMIPTSVLRGNNLEYKLWWNSFVNILGAFILMYVAIKLNWGIIGLLSAPLVTSILVGYFSFITMKRELPWTRFNKPDHGMVREMTGHGGWYMLNSLMTQLYQSADIIILGIITTFQTVAFYSICKAMLFRVSESLANLFGAPAAGIGQLIGYNNNDAVIKTRENLLRITILMIGMMGGGFLALNKHFIILWMSERYYLGDMINLIFVCGASVMLFSAIDDMILQCVLQFKTRSFIRAAAVIVMSLSSYVLAYYWSTLGAALGMLLGASVFTIMSFVFLSRQLGVSSWRALSPLMNTLCAVVALLLIIYFLTSTYNLTLHNWWEFFAAVMVIGTSMFIYLLIFGITAKQRTFYFEIIRSRYPHLRNIIGR